ncbi:MAG TPA: SelB C-terminal domain-containing protein [Smithella sp.]|nr:SelB C-terminal domain-containing protein [Smithella sp.]
MKHLVLGTAGHVDHGKTALIKALMGVDTDRLKEERERGISIELGFASLQINEELCFALETLEKLSIHYKAQLIKDSLATRSSFKDLTGLSRKYIIPLMEYFDTSKLTVRAGDHRILR